MTTEDNEDQGALNVVAQRLAVDHYKGALTWERRAERILSALSEAGYTVVKTEWEYGYTLGPGAPYNVPSLRVALEVKRGRAKVRVNDVVLLRRLSCGPWEPVPESDTLGGGANG